MVSWRSRPAVWSARRPKRDHEHYVASGDTQHCRTNFDHSSCYRDWSAPTYEARRANGAALMVRRVRSRRYRPTRSAAASAAGHTRETTPLPPRLRRRRAAAAKQYQPDKVRLLLVAQAPPDADDRYFYFPDVAQHDWLFRAVARAILPHVEPTRTNKASLLAQLRDRGIFLIDLKPDPVDGSDLSPYVPALLDRIAELEPERIILIKADVFRVAYPALAAAGLPGQPDADPLPFVWATERIRGRVRSSSRRRVTVRDVTPPR